MSQKIFFFQKNTLCHSFRIIVIPSVLLSFLPDYCHSFQIIVIPSGLVSFLLNIVISSKSLPFQICVILNSSSTLPYPKGEKNGHFNKREGRVKKSAKISVVIYGWPQWFSGDDITSLSMPQSSFCDSMNYAWIFPSSKQNKKTESNESRHQ